MGAFNGKLISQTCRPLHILMSDAFWPDNRRTIAFRERQLMRHLRPSREQRECPVVAGFPPCWSHQQYVIGMRRTADYRLYSDLYGPDMGRQSSPTKGLSTLRRFGSRRRSTGTREPSLSVSGNSAGNHRLSPGCLLVVIISYYLLEQYFMIM